MAVDYSVFQTQYENFNKLLFQIQALRAYGDQYAVGQTADTQSFADALESAAGKVKVPESMDAIFEEAAQTYQVPVALLKAVGKVESDFNPKAVSSAGAQGVMQLMPGTAKELGVTDPFDARSNIMGGAKYLAQKLKKYNGDIDLTLAAYNAGSGTVAKYGGVPSFTRKYIEKVKSYMGQNLTTGKTVNTQTCSQTTSAARAYSQPAQTSGIQTSSASTVAQLETVSNILERVKNGYSDYGQEDAQYYTQMMKLQMQNQAIGALGQLLSDDEEKEALFTL
ncbi:MAG: lytic transglycosylase domain-containing protein [Lachnospiraceae bacterium]|nr:lytic transglycosylase domain-containing protein [Lachnospiraceae bacterium]